MKGNMVNVFYVYVMCLDITIAYSIFSFFQEKKCQKAQTKLQETLS
jgi:hypothetical protein